MRGGQAGRKPLQRPEGWQTLERSIHRERVKLRRGGAAPNSKAQTCAGQRAHDAGRPRFRNDSGRAQGTRVTPDAEGTEHSTFGRRGLRSLMLQTCLPFSELSPVLKSKMWKSLETPPHFSPYPTHFQVLPTTISKFSVLNLLFPK